MNKGCGDYDDDNCTRQEHLSRGDSNNETTNTISTLKMVMMTVTMTTTTTMMMMTMMTTTMTTTTTMMTMMMTTRKATYNSLSLLSSQTPEAHLIVSASPPKHLGRL